MSCSSGSNAVSAGAKTAARIVISTTTSPNSAVRRRTSRMSSTAHSRSAHGRGAARMTDSVTTEGGEVNGDLAGASSETDPRVEVRVHHVDQEVQQDEGAREQEHRRLHDRVVAIEDRLHG